jgi:hypothetical protein
MKLQSPRLATLSPFRLFVGAICALVAAVIVGGLYVGGSPADQRVRRLDQTRVDDLRNLHYAVDSYYSANGHLPDSADVLKDPQYGMYRFADPDTGAAYEYIVADTSNYQLCATFALASEMNGDDPRFPKLYPLDPNFSHGAGRACFDFNAVASQLGSCGPNWTCPDGNECVSLPNNGQRCVPKGQACTVAGCPDSCVIAESYPPQIHCTAAEGGEPSPAQDPSALENSCALMSDPKSGKVGCYGCANGRCSTAPKGWAAHTPKTGSVGIPYACYAGDNGCELAQ